MSKDKVEKKAFGNGWSREARTRAAVILETLSGLRATPEAAEALGVSPMRYYTLEQSALAGLIAACEPRARGARASQDRELSELRRELNRQRRESERYKAMHRVLQKTAGIPDLSTSRGKDKMKGGKRRRPIVRALRAIDRLKREEPEPLKNDVSAHAPELKQEAGV
jgi:hypothetical protein